MRCMRALRSPSLPVANAHAVEMGVRRKETTSIELEV